MYRKNTAGQFVCFQGVDASSGGIKSGVTWTVRRCIDGTFAAGGGTVTEDSTNGWYKYAMSQADTNGNDISFNFTGTGAVPQTVNIITTAADPTNATTFGIGNLDAAVSSRSTYAGGAVASVTAAVTVSGFNSGAITDSTFTFPAESAGRPTGFLSAMRRLFEWQTNKRTRDRSTGNLLLRNAADSATLETQTQSTASTVDTITQGV
jgi:hypothetical protein